GPACDSSWVDQGNRPGEGRTSSHAALSARALDHALAPTHLARPARVRFTLAAMRGVRVVGYLSVVAGAGDHRAGARQARRATGRESSCDARCATEEEPLA